MRTMAKKTKGRVKAFEAQINDDTERQKREPRKAVDWKKKKKVRINRGRMALTAIVLLLVVGLGMSIKNIFDLRAEQKALQEEKKALVVEKKSLQEELDNVDDYDYIEEQARIQLKLIKPGEILYILDDEEIKKEKDREDKDEKDN